MKDKTDKIEVPSFTISRNYRETAQKSKKTTNCFRADEKWIEDFITDEFRKAYKAWELEVETWSQKPQGRPPKPPKPEAYASVARKALHMGVELLKELQNNNLPFPSPLSKEVQHGK